jgi:serine/threonine-protein kinase RsbW
VEACAHVAQGDESADDQRSDLSITLQATLIAPAVARQRLGRWLAAMAWPHTERDDVVLAVNEAVSNAIEHAYGVTRHGQRIVGEVSVQVRIVPTGPGDRDLLVTVRDDGGWKPPSDTSDARNGGFGFVLLRELTDDLQVDGREDGTTVTFRLHSTPRPKDRRQISENP